jgi:hypothetical protein
VVALQEPNLQKLISIRFELIRLLEVLGFDSERLSRNYRSMILSHFPKNKEGVEQSQQSLCTANYSTLARASLYLSDVQLLQRSLGNKEQDQLAFVEIMTCLAPTAPEVVNYLVQEWSRELQNKVSPYDTIYGQILSVVSRHTVVPAKPILSLLKSYPEALNFVLEQILSHQAEMEAGLASLLIQGLRSPADRSSLLSTLSEKRTQDLSVQKELLRINQSQVFPPEFREEVARALEVMEPIHLEVQLEISKLYLDGTNTSIGPRALRRARKQTVALLVSELKDGKLNRIRIRRALRLLASADPSNPLLVSFVKTALVGFKAGGPIREDLVLAGQILNEGLIDQFDDQLANLVLASWRKGHREQGMARYLAAQFQGRADVIREMLQSWKNISPADPQFAELKSLLESRVIWKPEILDTVFEMIRTSKVEALSLELIGFLRMAIVPAEFKLRVVSELEAVLASTKNKNIRAELREVLPVLRADAGLKSR